jgi:hypothetical protein
MKDMIGYDAYKSEQDVVRVSFGLQASKKRGTVISIENNVAERDSSISLHFRFYSFVALERKADLFIHGCQLFYIECCKTLLNVLRAMYILLPFFLDPG